MANIPRLLELKNELKSYNAALVAVSKTKPNDELMQVYNAGHKIFGENYVQELCEKQAQLPPDILWHYIGHLQTNKVKDIVSFATLIHGVDSEKLLKEINKQGEKNGLIVSCLLQVYIAQEETKFGFDFNETTQILKSSQSLKNIKIKGLMGMASNTDNLKQVENEFQSLSKLYQELRADFQLTELSMGMTNDYKIALNCGSTMVRIGSAIFGERKTSH
jgi:PLP dependent protein